MLPVPNQHAYGSIYVGSLLAVLSAVREQDVAGIMRLLGDKSVSESVLRVIQPTGGVDLDVAVGPCHVEATLGESAGSEVAQLLELAPDLIQTALGEAMAELQSQGVKKAADPVEVARSGGERDAAAEIGRRNRHLLQTGPGGGHHVASKDKSLTTLCLTASAI